MPAPLDSGDRRLLIGAALFLVVLLAAGALVAPVRPSSGGPGFPTSYSTGWYGAKGAYLLLKELGYSVERWDLAPTELPTDARSVVLILAEPVYPATSGEPQAIRRFVGAGGTVLATGASGAALIPDGEARAQEDFLSGPKSYPAVAPSRLSRGAPEITMENHALWEGRSTTPVAIYADLGDPIVLTYRIGNGRVIWWAAATPLTNGQIRASGNLALFLNSVGSPEGTRILWDEYFHGERGSLSAYLARTPLPWAALQIGILFLALVITFSRRSGPVRAPETVPRLSPIEFVETLGDLYQSAGAGSAAVATAYLRFRYLFARQSGLPAQAKIPDLCRSASARLGWTEPALLDTLVRSERAMRSLDVDESEALELVQRLQEYTERLEGRRRNAAQKKEKK
jgi:hypothetical protein